MRPKIIAIANNKGGVGKTTTTMNLAAGLVQHGLKVLAIDLDPQANLSDYLGHKPDNQPTIADLMIAAVNNQPFDLSKAIRKNAEGIDYIASNILLSSADFFLAAAMYREKVLKKILSEDILSVYDYVLIDCLPSLGVLLTNALAASHEVIIPVQTQKFALDGIYLIEQAIEMVKEGGNFDLKVIGMLPTMCEHTNMSKAVLAEIEYRYPDIVFRNSISKSVEATDSTYEQKSLIQTQRSKLGAQYSHVVKELLRRQPS